MNTAAIEEAADPGSQLATADVNLKILLRHKVIPDFYEAVGYPWWRRKHFTKSVVQGDTTVTISSTQLGTNNSVGKIRTLSLNDTPKDGMKYIGDRDDLVMSALLATEQARPVQYWHQLNATPPGIDIYFQNPSNAAFTLAGFYDNHIYFSDDTTAVDLAPFIPHQFQWGLVEMLKAELYERRFGIGDNRFQLAKAEGQRWVAAAMENLEGARGRRMVYAG